MLPELVFIKIMLMIGLESLDNLHRCRQVCKAWNEKILQNFWESQSVKKILKVEFEKRWSSEVLPSDEQITQAKWLGKSFT